MKNKKTFLLQSGFWYFKTKGPFLWICKNLDLNFFLRLIHLSMVNLWHFWYEWEFLYSSLIIFFLLSAGACTRYHTQKYNNLLFKTSNLQNIHTHSKYVFADVFLHLRHYCLQFNFFNYCEMYFYSISNAFSNYVALHFELIFICFCHCDRNDSSLSFFATLAQILRSFMDVSCQAQYCYIPHPKKV